jgi:predicted DCC family thiol-disulfide oxidoreductase YuxK
MNHRITRGYFVLFRFLVGIYCVIHFAALLPFGAELFSSAGILPKASLSPFFKLFPNLLFVQDAPWMVSVLLCAASCAGLALALGRREGLCALTIGWISASLFDRNPLISNPSLPYLGWMMLALAALSFLKRRSDPWEFPRELFFAAWVVMALSYSYSGLTKLSSPSWLDGSAIREVLLNPLSRDWVLVSWLLEQGSWLLKPLTWAALCLELLFAPLCLSSRLRPWLWLAMVGMHLCLMSLIRFADLSVAMVLFHLLTFNPGWIAPDRRAAPIVCFFDGECGMCHGFVRFLIQEGVADGSVRVAPQSGTLFQRLRPTQMPDSIAVFEPASQTWLWKSRAVAAILVRLGGIWRPLGSIVRFVPVALADWAYDWVAQRRRLWFPQPEGACPWLDGAWTAKESV